MRGRKRAGTTIDPVIPPETGADWVEVTDAVLSPGAATDWAITPGCGAVVTFCGTVRDHAEGRPGVVSLEYEAYPEHATRLLAEVAAHARARWPVLGRIALLHRIGLLGLEEVSVVVVTTSPSRPEAFEAARFCIDTLKATVPIWKRETWAHGSDWSACRHVLPGAPVGAAGSPEPGQLQPGAPR